MRVDVHTHVVPERWEDWAARHGGGNWPRLEPRDGCGATIFTGAQFFRDIDDRSWDPAGGWRIWTGWASTCRRSRRRR